MNAGPLPRRRHPLEVPEFLAGLDFAFGLLPRTPHIRALGKRNTGRFRNAVAPPESFA